MNGIWKSSSPGDRLIHRADIRYPMNLSLREAQHLLNFVVFEPSNLSSKLSLGETSVRPEQPPGRPGNIRAEDICQTPWSEANPCSTRTMIIGAGRSLRVKQFLYDWAPPAASVAPLWDCPNVRGYPCQDTVAWIGKDFRDAVGAVIQLHRTQVELSVLEGIWTDSELVELLAGMQMADSDSAVPVCRARFHELNYWIRYRIPPYRVPYGLWVHPYPRPYEEGKPLRVGTALSELPSEMRILLPPASEWQLDSFVVTHSDCELMFRGIARESEYLILLVMDADHPEALKLPPEPESMSAEIRKRTQARSTDVWIAALTTNFGAWECWWEEAGCRYGLWTSASQQITQEGFAALVESLQVVSVSPVSPS